MFKACQDLQEDMFCCRHGSLNHSVSGLCVCRELILLFYNFYWKPCARFRFPVQFCQVFCTERVFTPPSVITTLKTSMSVFFIELVFLLLQNMLRNTRKCWRGRTTSTTPTEKMETKCEYMVPQSSGQCVSQCVF